MTVDREAALDDEAGDRAGTVPVSRGTVLAYGAAGALLVGWFLFGALVQRQGVINSAGEALGTAFALLLIVSVVGMARRPGD